MTNWMERSSQLCEVVRPARKHRTDGFYVLPCPNGLGDGRGMLEWVDSHYVEARRVADPFNWYDIPGGLQARWFSEGHGRDYRVVREVRIKPAEVAG